MKERELNFVNNLNNRVRKRYYCDDTGEINNIPLEENDQIYSINDNQLYQVELNDIEETLNGSIITFNGRNRTKIESLEINIEPVQSGSGDPSPDNVRPISGWSAVNVWRTGKNLLDLSSVRGGNFDTVTSFPSNNATTNDYIAVKGGASYVWSQKRYPLNGGRYLRWYDKDHVEIGRTTIYSTVAYMLTAPLNACYAKFHWYQPSTVWQSKDDILADEPMFELGSTATAYEPYSGNQYTIQLGQTVYGATLDMVSGALVVDRAMVDLGTLSWFYRSNLGGMSAALNPMAKERFYAICSAYPFWGAYSDLSDKQCGYVYNNQIFVKDNDYTDTATFKAAMSGVQLVYELATPIEYTLTPQQISSLLGQNNVWADTGDIKSAFITTKGLNIYALDPPKI